MNNRLQKKCFIAATSFHLVLMGILLFGSAFFNREPVSENRPLLEFIPITTTDEQISGGGSRTAAPPPPPREPEQPRLVEPPQPRKPEVTPEVPKPQRDPDALEAKPKKDLPKVSTKEITRNKDKDKSTPKSASPNTNAQAEAKERQARQAALLSAANSIRNGMSSSTEVQLQGTGTGGPTYANFFDAVKKVYTEAWIIPDGVADDDATVAASVTIGRNGDVISYRVTGPSGNAQIDRSVQMTLERIRTVVPLPENAKESQRTVTIKFNARLKRGLG